LQHHFSFELGTILTTITGHDCPSCRTRILLLAPCPKFGGHFTNQILIAARQKAEAELASTHERLTKAKEETNSVIRQGHRVKLVTSITAGVAVLIAAGAFSFAVYQGVVAKGKTEETQRAKQKLEELNPELARAQSELAHTSTKLANTNTKLANTDVKLVETNQKFQNAETSRRIAELKAQNVGRQLSDAEKKRQITKKELDQAEQDLAAIQKTTYQIERKRQAAEIEQQKLARINQLEQSASTLSRKAPSLSQFYPNYELEKSMIAALELGQELRSFLRKYSSSRKGNFSTKESALLKSSFLLIRDVVNLPSSVNDFFRQRRADTIDYDKVTFSPDSKTLIFLENSEDNKTTLIEYAADSEIKPVLNEGEKSKSVRVDRRLDSVKETYKQYKVLYRKLAYEGSFEGFSPSRDQLYLFTRSNNSLILNSIERGALEKFKEGEFDIVSASNVTIRRSNEKAQIYPLGTLWHSYQEIKGSLTTGRFQIQHIGSSGGMQSIAMNLDMPIEFSIRNNVYIALVSGIRGIPTSGSFRTETLEFTDLLSKKNSFKLEGDFIDVSYGKERILVVKGNKALLYDFSGKPLGELSGGCYGFHLSSCGAFIPNQERLFLPLDYGITRLYDFSGNVLAEFNGSYFMMSPDGQFLITRLVDGQYRLWRLDSGLDDLLMRGCNWLQPYLKFHPEELKRLRVCQASK
jgi:hypothetical protein